MPKDEKTENADTKSSTKSSTKVSSGIEITCNTCYIKGEATARLTLGQDFNISETLQTVEDSVSDTISNITEWVENIDIDWSEAELDIPPPPDIDFNVEIPDFPEAIVEFQFDGTELYVDLSTVFSAGLTYTLTLFKKPLAVDLDDLLFLGFVFSVDLILSLENELEIKHGFHIKLDDGILLKMAMFSKEATDLTL